MSDELRKFIGTNKQLCNSLQYIAKRSSTRLTDKLVCEEAADRIEELEAENKLLNEQMTAIEEMGTESLNALPDCLMRLAPALVENDDLKAKLAKAVEALEECVEEIDAYIQHQYPHDHPVQERHRQQDYASNPARLALAELKGQT